MVAVAAGKDDADRWLVWPYLFLTLFPISLLALHAFNIDLEGMLVLAVWAFILFAFLLFPPFFAYAAYRSGRKRRALSLTLVPVLVILAVLSVPVCSYLGSLIFFYRINNSLQKDVDKTAGQDSQKLVIWLEGGFASVGYGFVYDGSDEVAKPAGKQSAAWKLRAAYTELGDDCFGASHITGHFYSFSTTHGCR